MKVSFLTSTPVIPKVDVSTVEIALDSFVERDESYVDALEARSRSGVPIVQFGGRSELGVAESVIAWSLDAVVGLREAGRNVVGVLVRPEDYESYVAACDDDSLSIIALSASDETDRIRFVRNLVESREFCTDKTHWLYGVPNPAELGAYREFFSAFVRSKIELAICSTCFLYSLFGIRFSDSRGVLERLSEIDDSRLFDLGLLKWLGYEPDREQTRLFHLNVDTVNSFAQGKIAGSYVERVYGILELGGNTL